MLEIDVDLIISDLRKTAAEFFTKAKINNSFFKKNYNSFCILNEALATIYDYAFDEKDIFYNKELVDESYENNRKKEIDKLIGFFNNNQELLLKVANNLLDFDEKINFRPISFFNKIKHYNKKDFIDIILSFYASFGNDTYKMMKKYFDENRIEMDIKNLQEEFTGYCVALEWLKSAYIFTIANHYSSSTASIIVHELGHIYDYEKVSFTQGAPDLFSDCLIEVPSIAFEVSFNSWLKENKIDEDGASIITNYTNKRLFDYMLNYYNQIKREELIFDSNGNTIAEDKQTFQTRDDMMYGLGYLFGYNLNYIRKNSGPNEFLKILDNLITLRKGSTLEQSIERMGISVDDFTSANYIKPQIEEEYLTLKKKYKF